MMFENKSWWWLHLQLLTLTSTSTLTYNLFTELGTAQPQLVLILIISVPSIDVTKKFSDQDFCNLVSKLETETLGISLKIWNWDFILLVSKMRLRHWCFGPTIWDQNWDRPGLSLSLVTCDSSLGASWKFANHAYAKIGRHISSPVKSSLV